MERTLPIALIVVSLLSSCAAPPADPNAEKEAANKKTFENLMSAWSTGNDAVFDSLIADNMVDHNPDPMIKTTGKQMWKDAMKMYRGSFPDMKAKPQVLFAEGDWVAGCATISGTQSGMMMGKPGSGKSMTDVTGIDLCRFENGKMVEHWGVFDSMTMMMQLGMMGGPMEGDSAAMGDMKEHMCNAGCKDGNHNYLHGEKGHVCGPDCPAMKEKRS